MSEKFRIIDKFIIALKNYNPNIIQRANSPISENNIYSLLNGYYDTDFIFQFSKYFSKICNGINIIYDNLTPASVFNIFPDYSLNSMENVLKILKEDDFYYFSLNKFLPLFSSGHGEYLGFYTEDFKKFELDSKVYICSTSDIEIENYCEIYQSINIMLKTHIIGYEKTIYYVEEDDCLEMNFHEYWKLQKKMNPEIKYWNR